MKTIIVILFLTGLQKVEIPIKVAPGEFCEDAWMKVVIWKDNPNYKADGNTIKGVGPLMGTVKYNFDIHGNSGIAFGDTFTITGLPEKYTRAGEFTTTSIEHSIDGINWKTTIEGQFRPKA